MLADIIDGTPKVQTFGVVTSTIGRISLAASKNRYGYLK
jgi:hypothetical protein